jgi:ankyrin repeat protein
VNRFSENLLRLLFRLLPEGFGTKGAILPSDPLRAAIFKRDLAGVESLLRNGKDPNELDEGGITSLHAACLHRKPEIVSLLLKYGANPNLSTDSGVTPLMWAASNGNTDVVQILIMSGADVNLQDVQALGGSALHWALGGNPLNEDIIRMLLEAGADPNLTDAPGRTALALALLTKRRSIVRLIERAINEQHPA